MTEFDLSTGSGAAVLDQPATAALDASLPNANATESTARDFGTGAAQSHERAVELIKSYLPDGKLIRPGEHRKDRPDWLDAAPQKGTLQPQPVVAKKETPTASVKEEPQQEKELSDIIGQIEDVLDRKYTTQQKKAVLKNLEKLAESKSSQLKEIARESGQSLEEVKAHMLKDIYSRLVNGGQCYQDLYKNTCTITASIEGALFQEQPELVVKMAVDLLTSGKAKVGSEIIKFNPNDVEIDRLDKSPLFSQVVQQSVSRHIVEETPNAHSFDPKTTSWKYDVKENGKDKTVEITGLFAVQVDQFIENITGEKSYIFNNSTFNDQAQLAETIMGQMEDISGMVANKISSENIVRDEHGNITGIKDGAIKQFNTDTGGIYSHVKLDRTDSHGQHCMRLFKFEDNGQTYVVARNTWPDEPFKVYTAEEFEARILEAHLDTNVNGRAVDENITATIDEYALSIHPATQFVALEGRPVLSATNLPEALSLPYYEPVSLTLRSKGEMTYSQAKEDSEYAATAEEQANLERQDHQTVEQLNKLKQEIDRRNQKHTRRNTEVVNGVAAKATFDLFGSPSMVPPSGKRNN